MVGVSAADAYRDTLVAWGDATEAGDTQRANRLFTLNHERFNELRTTAEGRRAISALLTDPNAFVRSGAAAHCLLWAPNDAETVLESLQGDADIPPEVQISAEYTLKTWHSGALDFDW